MCPSLEIIDTEAQCKMVQATKYHQCNKIIDIFMPVQSHQHQKAGILQIKE